MFIVQRLVAGNRMHPPQWVDVEAPEIEAAKTSADAERAARREIDAGGHGVVKRLRVLSWVNELNI